MRLIENIKKQFSRIRSKEESPNLKQTLNQIRTIRILLATLFFIVIISLMIDIASPKINLNPFDNNQERFITGIEEGIPVDTRPLPWNIQVSPGYSIEKNGVYSDQYIEIYYESFKDTYHVNVKEGYEYAFPQIQRYLEIYVLPQIEEFQKYREISTTQVVFHDLRRPEGYPTPAYDEDGQY